MPIRPPLTRTPQLDAALSTVQNSINAMPYEEDITLYQLPDFWQRLGKMRRGDCEDYAIEKRFALHEDHGIDLNDLRLALCWIESAKGPGTGAYHAVLIVPTDDGDMVLDNRYADVRRVSDMPYLFHKMQDPDSPTGWQEISNR